MTLFYSILFTIGLFAIIDIIEIIRDKKFDRMNPIQKYEYHRKHLTKKQIRRLRIMPYSEYLKTDHWKLLRAATLYRDKYKCRDCRSTSSLQVHHRTYIRRGFEKLSDVITLCDKCHKEQHKI